MARLLTALALLAAVATAPANGAAVAGAGAPEILTLSPEQQKEHDEYLKAYANWQQEVLTKQKEFSEYVQQASGGKTTEPVTPQVDLFFEEGHGIDILEDYTFDRFMFKNERVLVFFYAPWCHHSAEAKTGFLEAAKILQSEDFGILAAHNCQSHPLVCHNLFITGLPSFKFFKNGQMVRDYVGPRSKEGFLSFMEFPDAPPPPPPPPPPPGPFHDKDHQVVILGSGTEEGTIDFDTFVHAHDRTFVMFHAPWCPHSKETKPAFIQTAEAIAKLPNEALGVAAAVDCHDNEQLCHKFNIQGLPTFKFFKTNADGKTKDVIEYISVRSHAAFMEFLKNPVAIIPPPPQPPRFKRKDEL